MPCLVIKLDGEVSDNNLPILGKFKIHVSTKNASPLGQCNSLALRASEEIHLEALGDGHFTNSTLTENNGKTLTIPAGTFFNVFFGKGDYDVLCDTKYALTRMSNTEGGPLSSANTSNISVDIEDLRYATGLTELKLIYTDSTGDIAALAGLENLTTVTFDSSKAITGDIEAFSGLAGLTNLSLASANGIYGDIYSLRNLTSLTNLTINYRAKITGDVSALSGMTNMSRLNMNSAGVSGDIAVFGNMTSLATIDINNCKALTGDISVLGSTNISGVLQVKYINGLTGDISELNNNTWFVSNLSGRSAFSWGTNRSRCFIGLEAIDLGDDLDAMFINQATLSFHASATAAWAKQLNVKGTRTSASDAAVATLKSKGVTITVNGVAL